MVPYQLGILYGVGVLGYSMLLPWHIIRVSVILTVVLSWASTAVALQPLEDFLHGAAHTNVDYKLSQAARWQKETSLQHSWGDVIPRIELLGTYTRNQYGIALPLTLPNGQTDNIVVQPSNQLDGTVKASVPLFDLTKFAMIAINKQQVRVARFQEDAAYLSVQSAVAQNYYQLVANMALVEASQSALSVARSSLDLTQQRFHAGSAAALDVDRARAEVERQVQQLASAELGLALAAQSLASLTSVVPDIGKTQPLDDDLHMEQPLDTFMPEAEKHPTLASARENTALTLRELRAAKLVLAPSVDLSFTERFTNATAFTNGHEALWLAALNLRWELDLTKFADIHAAEAQHAAVQQQERKAQLEVNDNVHRAWHTVLANIARSRSARVQAEVSKEAATLAQDRYRVGSTTQLDLLQAQRDAFGADVTRIQADADLVNSRLQLQVIAGRRIQMATTEKQE